MKVNKYKPVTFIDGKVGYYRNNTYQQELLLKAMQVSDDPKVLRDAIGVKAVADVVRTLDKLTIRKEYHESLARKGVSLDYIVENIKNIADTSSKDATRLKALQTLLRSIGLERYEDIEDKGKGWEEMLVDLQQVELQGGPKQLEVDTGDYEVIRPPVPKSEQKRQEDEAELGRELYAK